MKLASTPFHAHLLTRQTRNCAFIFGRLRDRRWVHDVTRTKKIGAGRVTVLSTNSLRERNAWSQFNRLAPLSRLLTTNKPAASPAPEPTNAPAKSSSSGDKDPDPLHKSLRNRLPRIAAVKKEGTEDDSEYYSELTVPVSFPGAPGGGAGGPGGAGLFSITRSPLFDAALTTFIGLTMVFIGGIAYVEWYKKNVVWKMEKAFAPGYDPALAVATHAKERTVQAFEDAEEEHRLSHVRRDEQDFIDRIVSGKDVGHYYMILGPKGTGKTTMIYDAMARINADGVSLVEAHPDMEVFRLRLGKALNYEFYEDSQTGLFQRRDPREGGAALDIERALSKLEKVALGCAQRRGRPIVLIFNNVHFFRHTEEGSNMLLLLQQRAESWAESGIVTCIFSSDDYWPYSVVRKSSSRMIPISIYDLKEREAIIAARRFRRAFLHFHNCDNSEHPSHTVENDDDMRSALQLVGGRLSHINRMCKASPGAEAGLTKHATELVEKEKGWLLSLIGLIPDHDDDVMDEQKWSSCSWLLLREFVRLHKKYEEEHQGDESSSFHLPAIPYYKARQIMTRTDFIDELDRNNIISIDLNHNIRPDSMLILQAARQVVEEEGFDEVLDDVRERVDEIESLHRTRELTFKDVSSGDRIRLVVDKGGAQLVEE